MSIQGLKRIIKELQIINKEEEEYYENVGPEDDSNMLLWDATIIGPDDTPYEGGKYLLKIEFSSFYPFRGPKIYFETKIFHPNIHQYGEICRMACPWYKDAWSPDLTMKEILLKIIELLKEPVLDFPYIFCTNYFNLVDFNNEFKFVCRKDKDFFNQVSKEVNQDIIKNDYKYLNSFDIIRQNIEKKEEIHILREINILYDYCIQEKYKLVNILKVYDNKKINIINEEKRKLIELEEEWNKIHFFGCKLEELFNKIDNDEFNILKLKEIKNEFTIKENKINDLKMDYQLLFKRKDSSITIIIAILDENIECFINCPKNYIFSKIKELFYDKYPEYNNINNYFTINNHYVFEDKSLEDNNIKDNDIITLK